MVFRKSIIVYATHPLAQDTQPTLIEELTAQPIRQSTPALDLPDHFELSTENTLDKSVDDIVTLHKRWAKTHAVDAQTISGSLFVVVDEGMSPASHPHTVLIVKVLGGEEEEGGDEKHQAVRVLASNAGNVITLIEGGHHGWDDFWEVAQANGGHFPGE